MENNSNGPSPFVLSGTSPPHKSIDHKIKALSQRATNSIDTATKPLFDRKIDGNEPQEEWLSSAEAAAYLKIPVGTLRNMTSNGQLPFYKLGRLNRYLRSELKKLLLAQKRGV